jgi:nucleotide-binding universal stress UspA family protein
MPVVVAIVAVWLVVGAGAALLMHRKGHDMFSWSILFIALGPLAFPLAISAHRHPPGETAGRNHQGALDVLVGHDGSPSADRALSAAVGLFGSQMTSLTLAAVVDLEASTTVQGHETEREETRRLQQIAGALAVPCGPVETVILHGNPARALAQYAAAHGYELVVVGSDGRPPWQRVIAGSVARRLSMATPVPVFVGPRTH